MSFPISPINGQVAVINSINYSYSTATLAWTRVAGVVTATNSLLITGNTSATSTVTGALQVVGGVGVGGNIYAGNIYSNGQLVATGSASFNGGTVTGAAQFTNTTASTSTNTGAVTVAGGVGIGGGLFVGGTVTATSFVGNLTGTASTATSAATAYSTIGTHTAGTGLTGSTFNGSANQTWSLNTTTLMATAVTALSASGSAGSVANALTIGTGLSGTAGTYNGSAAVTVSLNTSTLMQTAVNHLGGSVNATTGVFSGITTVTNTTAATSTTTGALQVAGGVGIGGGLYVGGVVTATSFVENGYAIVSQRDIGNAPNQVPLNQYLGSMAYQDQSAISVGAINFTGVLGVGTATNYGVAGQVLQSNGSGASPSWTSTVTQVLTVAQNSNASYYPTFVSANNATAAGMSIYTTSSFTINPATGLSTHAFTNAGNTVELLRLSNPGAGGSTQGQLTFYTANTLYGSISGGYGSVAPQMVFNLPSATTGNYIWQNNSVEQLRINTAGQVGVGSNYAGTGGALLAVNGGAYINGTVTATSLSIVANIGGNGTSTIATFYNTGGAVAGINLANTYGAVTTSSFVYDYYGSVFGNGTPGSGLGIGAGSWGLNYVSGRANFGNHWFRDANNNVLFSITSNGSNTAAAIGYNYPSYASSAPNFSVIAQGAVLIGTTATLSGAPLSVNGGAYVNGTVTATTFVGTLTGTASTATNAATAYSTIGTHTAGTGLTGSTFNGSANQTWSLNTSTLMQTAVTAITASSASGSAQINTQAQTANAFYYLTFVGANNATATGMSVYTTSSFAINPATGNVGIGTSTPGYKLEVNGSFAATTKSFIIDHPTKSGMKLRHGSLEGPENGVYVRGRLTNSNTIQLPDYWTGLVDETSITVDLTPVGKHQKLFVQDISNNTVIVGNDNRFNSTVNCFYTVWAERKDVDKLVVEISNPK